MRGVKPETKIAVSEAQERAKAETDIRVIFNRTRAAATAKKCKSLSHRALVMSEAKAKEIAEMSKTNTRLLQRPRPSQRPRL